MIVSTSKLSQLWLSIIKCKKVLEFEIFYTICFYFLFLLLVYKKKSRVSAVLHELLAFMWLKKPIIIEYWIRINHFQVRFIAHLLETLTCIMLFCICTTSKVYNYELTDVKNFANLTVVSLTEFITCMIYLVNRKLIADNMCTLSN